MRRDDDDEGENKDEDAQDFEPNLVAARKAYEWKLIKNTEILANVRPKQKTQYRHVYTINQDATEGFVLGCAIHKDCGALLRFERAVGDLGDYQIYEHGVHASEFMRGNRGVHPYWIDEADSFLRAGMAPKKVFNTLQSKATQNTLTVFPTVRQLQNRKKFLFKPGERLDTLCALRSHLEQKKVS
jgi:hypothetical protein